MSEKTHTLGRVFIERLPYTDDLLQVLNEFCGKRKVTNGTLSLIGAAAILKRV